jgi:LytR cell envelope-related transcriptional attenuator
MDDDRPDPGSPSGSLSALRAAAVLVVFVIAVVVLVAVGTRPSVSSTLASVAAGSTTTTTTGPGSTTSAPASASSTTASTTTTTTAHHRSGGATTTTVAKGSVSVVVANATSTNGLAAHYSTQLGSAGWNMKTPVDANTSEATSAVYYAAGQQQAAQEVAAAIGVKPAQVQPLTTSVPVTGVTGTDVVVVIGQDLASSTTATTAAS